LLLLSRAVFPFFKIFHSFFSPRPILTDGCEVDVTTGRHQCRRKLLALWERWKGKKELDTVAIRIVGTSHTSRILFLFHRERSCCAHTQLEFSIAASREFRYHIWCPSKSVTMLDALASQLALYIEPCCWWHHSSYYIHPLKQWHR
jgi:hypothetical protein